MMRRLQGLTTSLIVFTVLGAATLALASSPGGNRNDGAKEKILRVRGPEVDRVVTDLGQPGRTQGDQVVIRKNLFFEKEPDKQVGVAVIPCVVTEIEGDQQFEVFCDAAYRFEGEGEIESQATAHFDLVNPGEFEVAITGGTGKFRSARGWIRVIQSTEVHRLIFHVER